MKLRKANLEEVETIRGWISATAKWLESKRINQWERFIIYNGTEICLDDYNNGKLYVLESRSGEIIGALTCGEAEEIDRELWDDFEGVTFVHRVIVDSKYRGLNVGRCMLNMIKEEVNNEIRLNCVECNEHLYKYYSSIGFEYCGARLGYHLFKM